MTYITDVQTTNAGSDRVASQQIIWCPRLGSVQVILRISHGEDGGLIREPGKRVGDGEDDDLSRTQN